MPGKSTTKPKRPLTDAERHKRFVEMAREVKASNNASAFDKAFDKVAKPGKPKPHGKVD